jgi:predicted MFS family arabinose efflux permease
MSSLMIFVYNLKNFGLRYYSDQAITKTSLVAMPAFFVTRVSIGAIVDKFGMLFVYRIVTAVIILTVLAFYMFMDNEWVFYLCVMLFFGSYGSTRTMHTISTSFIYDHEVGKRLQKYMHCAAVIAGMAAVLIHDNIVLQIFG